MSFVRVVYPTLIIMMVAWRAYNVNINWVKVLFASWANVFVEKIFLELHSMWPMRRDQYARIGSVSIFLCEKRNWLCNVLQFNNKKIRIFQLLVKRVRMTRTVFNLVIMCPNKECSVSWKNVNVNLTTSQIGINGFVLSQVSN